jgi:mannose-6-phosphate isomerase-like protein (cupin superfamily)
MSSAPAIQLDGEGERIIARGVTVLVKAATPRVTITDHSVPAGFPGPPLHVHPGFDEVFVVLEGTLTVRVRDAVQELGPGSTAYGPGAVPHTFANPSGEPLRFMVAITPGGFEAYFRALAAGDEAGVAAASDRFGYAPSPAELVDRGGRPSE